MHAWSDISYCIVTPINSTDDVALTIPPPFHTAPPPPLPVLDALNQLPKQQHGVNIMRVKAHLLASQGALYR